jgi:peptide/nickel transport system permease protein
VTATRPRARTRGSLARMLITAAHMGRVRVGALLVLVVVGTALLGPLFAPHSPLAFVAAPYGHSATSGYFGADYLGRDVLSRFLDGGRSLLLITVASALLGVGAGASLGMLAALLRSRAGEAIMRTLDVIMAFPSVVLALLFITILGPRIWLLIVLVALVHVPQTARVVRAGAAEVVERDFVRAAEIIGVPRRSILTREILPNVTGLLAVELGLRLTVSIAIIAALSFLGFGVAPPNPDWGLMISENKVGLTLAPWGVLLPVIAIAVLTVGVNLAADGIGRAAARISAAQEN